MSIEVRQTSRGERRYDVRLRDAAGKEYSRSFRTRKEAERFSTTQRADRVRGTWIDPRLANATFQDVAIEWLGSHPGKKESSLVRDESILNSHLLPKVGRMAIGQISPSDVQKMVSEWSANLAPRTVRRHYAVLRAILNFAVDTDRIGRSPCRKVKLPEVTAARHHLVSPAELHELAEALGPQDGAMVYLAAALGLRWGEAAGLRVRDIDFLSKTISIETQRTRGRNGRMVTGAPKWNSTRTMAAPAELSELLSQHLVRRGVTGAEKDALVFVGTSGEPLNHSNWRQRVWVPACKRTGLDGLKFQALRTANTTAMVALDVDVKTAQTRAGHRNAKTTLDIYVRPTAVADRRAADRLGAYFLPGADQPVDETASLEPHPAWTRDGAESRCSPNPGNMPW